MAYVKVNIEIFDHKKTTRAARSLSIERVHLVGHLASLWAYAWHNAPDGDLSDLSVMEIADAARWAGDPDLFVQVLVENRWLDREGTAHAIHNWLEHSGKIRDAERKKKEDNAKRQQLWRERQRDRNANITCDVTDRNALRNADVTRHMSRVELSRVEFKKPPTPFCDEPELSAPASPEPVPSFEDTPQESVKEPTRASKRTREVPKVPPEGSIAPEAILTLWNETRPPTLSAIRDLSGKRLKTLQKRIKQFPTIEEWQTAIRNLSSSPFHCGDGFRADFDWLLSEKGIRCFEGPLGSATPRKSPSRVPTGSTYGADPIPLSMLPPVEPIDLEAARRAAAEIENEPPKRRRM